MQTPKIAIVLAAGKGTRLKSELPKVLHPILGKPMLCRVLESLIPLNLTQVFIITGHQAQQVQAVVSQTVWPFEVRFVYQEPQLGTGHAVMQVLPFLPVNQEADVLITCGDMPLVPAERYASLMAAPLEADIAARLVTVALDNPTGYGRVLSDSGQFLRIVEEKDATTAEKSLPWVNAGIYRVRWSVFSGYLSKLDTNNAQKEFYLTDVFGLLAAAESTYQVQTLVWPFQEEVLGINSRQQLAEAVDILSRKTAERLMMEGVSLINPASITLAPEIQIGPDTVLHPGCYLEGAITIGRHCEIGPHTTMRGTIQIGNHCRIIQSYLDRAVTVGDRSYIGPFAHLRDNAVIGEQCRLGNFVEVKETRLGERSNAAHLCYLGDALVGDDVNMGAGSITANYDPIRDRKHQTIIEDGVKVGCNSVLIAPVTVAHHASVAAGSVITHDVASLDLAIARARQTSIPNWVAKNSPVPLPTTPETR